jgi:hypothetical protein
MHRYIYTKGLGGEQNFEMAEKWVTKAAEQGDKRAIDNLILIKTIIKSTRLQEQGKCFVATATLKNNNSGELQELRDFRDDFLSRYVLGGKFIKLYYKFGHIPARIIEKNIILRAISYVLIVKPLVLFSKVVK